MKRLAMQLGLRLVMQLALLPALPLAELLALNEGSVVELNRQAGELLDVMVNGTIVARGEIVTIDGRYGIRIVDVASATQRAAGIERR
jgi:flagellar motor switch protein FliN/FliY